MVGVEHLGHGDGYGYGYCQRIEIAVNVISRVGIRINAIGIVIGLAPLSQGLNGVMVMVRGSPSRLQLGLWLR